MIRQGLTLALALGVGTVMQCHPASAADQAGCKCIPGDACWPDRQEWNAFNASIGGRLVVPRPLAAPCHNPDFDAATCDVIRDEWTQPWLHDGDASSIMAAVVTNNSCDPFTVREMPCEAGNSITYAVNATDASDFAKAIAFATEKNIRLVIRNTGHDYMGKSTGKWALSVWTHHMKAVDYLDWNSTSYRGPAMRLGAGVQVEEAYEAAHAHGLLVVGGDCATVGVVGGYLQGGGHSALSSVYGMGADQVLEWEVVDGTGQVRRASPTENPDLYWALSGSSPGTFGIVSSVVVKVFPDMAVGGAQLRFDTNATRPDDFEGAVRKYHDLVPTITAAGGMGIALVTNTTFELLPLTMPNKTRAETEALLQPLVGELEQRGLAYSLNVSEHADWLHFWRALIKPNPTQLVQNAQHGGWMLPRAVLEEKPAELQAAIRVITEAGCDFVGLTLNVSRPESITAANSVLPAWRETALNVILSTPWPANADSQLMQQRAQLMTHTCVSALANLAPNTGAYMNEADPHQPGWQQAFYGANYDRLLAIKDKYDPQHVFYAHTAVGSEYYEVAEDGRMCQAGTPRSN